MDLHAWITQRVDEVEALALAQPPAPWRYDGDEDQVLAADDIHVAETFALSNRQQHATGTFIAAHDPATVLRRCEADRRILARHRAWPGSDYCDYCDADLTTRLADCPELLDLARAHGVTDEILAGLDRTQQPEPEPRHDGRLGLADILAPRTRMREVPPALRGPNWKP